MVATWVRSNTFAHGFFIAPLSLWLIWRARAELARFPPRPSWWALAPMAVAGFGWLLGELGTVNALSQIAFVTLIVFAVPAVLGSRAARAIAFPLGFLFFAVPIGDFMLPQLMEWTADFTVWALRLTGIPVFREGQSFLIPSGRWSVVEACSGVRYLIASLVVGTLYAYLSYRSLKRRLIFVAFSILVSIVANWLRAYMIVMIGHLSGNKLAVGIDHFIYGWIFFGVVMLLMFWIGGHWRDEDDVAAVKASTSPGSIGEASNGTFLLVTAVVALVTAFWPLAHRAIDRNDASSSAILPILGGVGGWTASRSGLGDWQPRFVNPSAELHQSFARNGVEVGLYVGYFRDQAITRKLVSSDNVLVASTDPIWSRVAGGTQPIVVDGRSVDVRTAELKGAGGEALLVWYWYWIDGRITASDVVAKGYIAASRLLGHGDDGAAIVVYTRKGQLGASESALVEFVRDVTPSLTRELRRTRDQR